MPRREWRDANESLTKCAADNYSTHRNRTQSGRYALDVRYGARVVAALTVVCPAGEKRRSKTHTEHCNLSVPDGSTSLPPQ